MKRLIVGGTVVTMNARRTIFPRGYVAVDGSVIRAVGPAEESPDPRGFDDVIVADGKIVVPGLINAHQHLWYTLCKGLGEGMLLEEWIERLLVPAGACLTGEDWSLSTTLGCLEMIRTGTTCAVYHMTAGTTRESIRRVAEASLAVGMRQVIAKEVRPQNLAGQLALAEELVAEWHGAGSGLVRMGLTVETTSHWVLMGTCSDELVVEAHRLARRHGLVITDHIAGGTLSRGAGYLRYIQETGQTDILYLQKLGVLDEHWLLIHAIWLQDRDIKMIAESGSPVVHCPTSHAMRAGGITPVRRLMDAGVNVALGSDGPMVDNSVDMVEQMKATCLEQNQLHLDPQAITPATALEMATINGARALGMDDQIGSLEAGKRADLAIFDLRQPHVGVIHRPITSLVTAARGTDAWLVMVNGQILLRDGAFTTVQGVDEILAEAQKRAEMLVERAGLGPLRDRHAPARERSASRQ